VVLGISLPASFKKRDFFFFFEGVGLVAGGGGLRVS